MDFSMKIPHIQLGVNDKCELVIEHHSIEGRDPLTVEINIAEIKKDGFDEAAKKLGSVLLRNIILWHKAQFAGIEKHGSSISAPMNDMVIVDMLVKESLSCHTQDHISTIELILNNPSTAVVECSSFFKDIWPDLKKHIQSTLRP